MVWQRLGITESHPSTNRSDWYQVHGGSLTRGPGVKTIRETFEHRRTHMHETLVNQANKFGTHNCNRGAKNCQRTVTINGSTTTKCRYSFERELIGYDHNDDHSPDSPTVIRQIPPVKGQVIQLVSLNGKKFLSVRWNRNHGFTYSIQYDCQVITGSSGEIQYVYSDDTLRNYLSKYVSKVEVLSDMAKDTRALAHVAAAEKSNTDFVKRVLREDLLERDYGVEETAFLVNNNLKLFEFSRPFVYVNIFGSISINFEAVNDNEIVDDNNFSCNYDSRRENEIYCSLVELYNLAPEDDKPYYKSPEHFNLMDFVSMFNKDWTPRKDFVVPHFMPHFTSRPESGEYLQKFLIAMLRCYCWRAPSLNDLIEMSQHDLIALGDSFFTPNEDKFPRFAKELWWTNEADYRLRVEHFDHTDGDLFPSPNNALNAEVPDPAAIAEVQAFYDETVPVDPIVVEQVQDQLDADLATENYDYTWDRVNLLNDWTVRSPKIFRDEAKGQGMDNVDPPNPVSLEQLNFDQTNVVNFLIQKVKAQLDGGPSFRLEICGQAGSGKTTVMRVFKDQLKLLLDTSYPHLAIGDLLVFSAPTGCAATLLPNQHFTLHKLLSLPIMHKKWKFLDPLTGQALANLQAAHGRLMILIIDEKSMLGCSYIGRVDQRLKDIFHNDLPFGGISVVLMGDFAQLPPIGDKPLYEKFDPSNRKQVKDWSATEIYGYDLYNSEFTECLTLSKTMRQRGDVLFQKLLDNMQNVGELTPAELEMLRNRSIKKVGEQSFGTDYTLITATHRDYGPFNRKKIREINGENVLVESINTPDSARSASASDAGGLHKSIVLVKGMKVMLTSNLDIGNMLSNGTMGIVKGILYFNDLDPTNLVDTDGTPLEREDIFLNEIPTVLVHFPSYLGPSCLPNQEKVYPVSAITCTWKNSRKESQSRKALPLVASYGMTIHKSQGQTLKRVMIGLGQKETPGLTYTALSRVPDLSLLTFKDNVSNERLQQFWSIGNSWGKIKADREEKKVRARATLLSAGLPVEQGDEVFH